MRDEDEITDCIVHSAQTEYKKSRDLYFDEYKKNLNNHHNINRNTEQRANIFIDC